MGGLCILFIALIQIITVVICKKDIFVPIIQTQYCLKTKKGGVFVDIVMVGNNKVVIV